MINFLLLTIQSELFPLVRQIKANQFDVEVLFELDLDDREVPLPQKHQKSFSFRKTIKEQKDSFEMNSKDRIKLVSSSSNL